MSYKLDGFITNTATGLLWFDRTVYGNKKNTATRKWWWWEELRQERDIILAMSEKNKLLTFSVSA
jgi:hypothetical protein